jgi:RNA polymerase sigma-70 factor, ECF subfamily
MEDASTGSEMAEPSDAELLRAAAEGRSQAFDCLVARHADRVFSFAVSALSGDEDEAADVVQEAFVEAFRHAGRFSSRGSALPWLMGIAANRLRTWRRRWRRRPRLLDEIAAPDAVEDEAAAGWGAPERVALALDVARALACLPPGYREPVILRFQQGMSYEEIGEALSISPATAAQRVHRAKDKLRVELADLAPEGGDLA